MYYILSTTEIDDIIAKNTATLTIVIIIIYL